MTIANLNSNLNLYMNHFLKPEMENIQAELIEMSRNQAENSIPVKEVSKPREIEDEYIPQPKPKVEVTLEERLSQVISPEEIKNLLSLLVKAPRISSELGQRNDLKA